jgi:acetyl esterase/lipase
MKINIRLRPDADVRAETIKIGKMSALVVRPKEPVPDAPGILWIHGGGYITGLKEMVYMSRAIDLVKEFHAVVICPDYRLAIRHPYPAVQGGVFVCGGALFCGELRGPARRAFCKILRL